MIDTISGAIDEEKLGKTYIHEHLCIDLSGVKKDPDANLDDIAGVIEELKHLKSLGVDSIVEVSNIGMGRDVLALMKIWEATGINIILSTGFYKEPYYPKDVYDLDYRELSKILIKEIREGIDGTKLKAHVIGEIGTSKDVITENELKVLKAAICAHKETGNPIFTHTSLGTMGLEQLEVFKKYKIDMSKILIGHLDLSCDMDYHLKIAEYGCYLGFDTIGKVKYQKDEVRIQCIKSLIERGYLDQIVLSQDMTRRSHLKKRGGNGYSYLMEKFIPKAKFMGISEAEINCMMVDNPKRLLNV
ncbi:phosphotriesterase family protein [Sporanaerobacter acetigenes]|uniref:phosphotriesterase family protein n=1 Tax=Sporanaerobacter acetigenes TaxID=165813 RepID=UPI00332C1B84